MATLAFVQAGAGRRGRAQHPLTGRKIAEDFSCKVAAAGYVIVSGLARGIDSSAHTAALTTGTVAVAAESPFGTEPLARHFPRRNRIISGLSLGVLIVEAAMKSGSLITARMAAEQNREVFATPGSPPDPRAEGTNKLIQDGAHMAVTPPMNIIRELKSLRRQSLNDPPGDLWKGAPTAPAKEPDESLYNKILEILSPTPVPIDEVIRATGAPIGDVLIVILELELAARIERQPGNKVNLV